MNDIVHWFVELILWTKLTGFFETEEPEFLKYINKHHIIGLLETKVSVSERISVDGYITSK